MGIPLEDFVVAVHPGGAILKVFVDAPALEFAEAAVHELCLELLERSELLSEWTIDQCEVQLHPELAQESLAAADGPDVPPADVEGVFWILDGLPGRFAYQYDTSFVRRFLVVSIAMTARFTSKGSPLLRGRLKRVRTGQNGGGPSAWGGCHGRSTRLSH
ncbi:hypothetical protein NI17_009210 [Thermobifida halotolerans]|uniref:Uncharacterized protein n=2 Tax=Thermobifida halotolerans TaxID=483545 RepID=A0AA97M0A5_9ACTN|nr:hypothetical protein [Thermobifida halotolerans]UOE21286.1 hypothetical protein NI17_009210 [Thermobifida halotolerans]